MYSMQSDQKSKESLESRGLDFAYNAIYDDILINGRLP